MNPEPTAAILLAADRTIRSMEYLLLVQTQLTERAIARNRQLEEEIQKLKDGLETKRKPLRKK